jgi:Tol biopolymer transport system component
MQVAIGRPINLTNGTVEGELVNPATRTLGFSPTGDFITLWNRNKSTVNAFLSVPTHGGDLRPYMKEMPDGISELDWSPDARFIVYHPPTGGDPLRLTDADGKLIRELHKGEAGIHCHFPTFSRDGRFVYFVRGLPEEAMDLWRVPAAGGTAERLTNHNSRVSFPTFLDDRTLVYLATDEHGSGPWIHSIDVGRSGSQPRRFSIGQEYLSLAGSEDGSSLVATRLRSRTATLWKVPIADGNVVVDVTGATPVPLQTASAESPRIGGRHVIYRASQAGIDLLWRLAGASPTPLYTGLYGRAVGGAAVAPDGRIAFVAQQERTRRLYLTNPNGSVRPLAEDLDVIGSPDWSPDFRSLAIAVNVKQKDGQSEPRVFTIPADGGNPTPLVDEYSIDPKWAPSGQFLIYSGKDTGANITVKAINADRTPHPLPPLAFTRGERRLVFAGTDDQLVRLAGDIAYKEFVLVNLKTGEQRPLTKLGREYLIRDFDVSADGREIVFDRAREESDIVLFKRPGR